MKDPDILFLSKRIDTLEKNQGEILKLLKKALSPTDYSEIDEIAQKAVIEDRQALRDWNKRQKILHK